MDKFWKLALGVGGLSSVGAFVFYSLYRNWLTLPIFANLSDDQTFLLMALFLIIVFLALLSLLFVYVIRRTNGEGVGSSCNDGKGAQLVRWGPVDGREPGIQVTSGDENLFIPWIELSQEINERLIPQVEYLNGFYNVAVNDFGKKKNWIVKVSTTSGEEVAHIWFGPDPGKLWKYDGLVRVGLPGSPAVVWQTFQRYADGSYRIK